jgi:hypothetical protein
LSLQRELSAHLDAEDLPFRFRAKRRLANQLKEGARDTRLDKSTTDKGLNLSPITPNCSRDLSADTYVKAVTTRGIQTMALSSRSIACQTDESYQQCADSDEQVNETKSVEQSDNDTESVVSISGDDTVFIDTGRVVDCHVDPDNYVIDSGNLVPIHIDADVVVECQTEVVESDAIVQCVSHTESKEIEVVGDSDAWSSSESDYWDDAWFSDEVFEPRAERVYPTAADAYPLDTSANSLLLLQTHYAAPQYADALSQTPPSAQPQQQQQAHAEAEDEINDQLLATVSIT